MKERPRISFIGYGSILNPDDVADVFGDLDGRIRPVRVEGFRRIFNQEASWRETTDDRRAVLNVVRSDGNWFNGVLIADLSRAEFNELRGRERGYRLIEVANELVKPYDRSEIETDTLEIDHLAGEMGDLVLTTTGRKVETSIEPIPDYLDLCKEGARKWGDEFFEDFLKTTETNSGDSLTASVNGTREA